MRTKRRLCGITNTRPLFFFYKTLSDKNFLHTPPMPSSQQRPNPHSHLSDDFDHAYHLELEREARETTARDKRYSEVLNLRLEEAKIFEDWFRKHMGSEHTVEVHHPLVEVFEGPPGKA